MGTGHLHRAMLSPAAHGTRTSNMALCTTATTTAMFAWLRLSNFAKNQKEKNTRYVNNA